MKSLRMHYNCRLLIAVGLATFLPAAAQDPLPSWNESSSTRSIVQFVNQATHEGAPTFVPRSERIAAFDNDGTPWWNSRCTPRSLSRWIA
jgi:hypothetical protein